MTLAEGGVRAVVALPWGPVDHLENHKHGMSDPGCPKCLEVVHRSLTEAEQRAAAEANAEWEAVPGATELREMYQEEIANRNGNDPANDMITVVEDQKAEEDRIKNALHRVVKWET